MPEKLNLICPICDKKMVHIWYGLPDEYIENLVNEKQIFYRGLEDKNVDRDSSDRIMYHCYNCNNSFSRNLNIVIHEEEVFYPYEEVENLICSIAEDVITSLNDAEINDLKLNKKYSHFGFGLYIRNNFIYKNDKIKYRLPVDDFGYMIFEKVIEKIDKE